MKYILGAYSQLPFGSDENAMETVLINTLKPLLTSLYSDNSRKMVLYLSICEYEFLEQKHPEINMLIYDLCKKSQLELLAGSYYDAMLPMIPTHERASQIEKSITYLRKRFGKKPKGMWCQNEYFSPSVLSILEMCGLDYLFISSYCQTLNSVIYTKPFMMNEMGKKSLIIPFDDKFSKEISEFKQTKSSEEKLLSSIKKLCSSCKDTIETIMISLDQIISLEKPEEVFNTISKDLNCESILPSSYFADNKITKNSYFPWGIYGRDFDLGKKTSINQIIIENPLLNRYYQALSFFKDYTKNLKNNFEKTKLKNCFLKANSTTLFLSDSFRFTNVRNYANKCLCEIENTLLQENEFPSLIDLSGDGYYHCIASSKNSIAYINPKGATISRFLVNNCYWDLMNHNGNCMFADSFHNIITSKKLSLANRNFEISSLDKRRMDFFATTGFIDLDNNSVNLIKRFKFRQNTTVLEVEFENNSNKELDKYLYENTICLYLTEDSPLVNTEADGVSVFSIEDKNLPFKLEFSFSDNVIVESKHVFHNTNNYLGDKKNYQYTQICIKKKLSLKPSQEDHLSMAMKIEKRKERK